MNILKAITSVVLGEFEDAAASFGKSPSTDNWHRLEAAMWARQGITAEDTMSKAVKSLPGLGLGDWVKTIRNIHEGKL